MAYDKREFLVDEDARRHFERDWSGQALTNLQRLLPDRHDQRYLATLEELIHIDLELAWQSWGKQRENTRPTLLEAYLAFFPDLYEGEILGRLVRQEYRVRQAAGDEVTMDDYMHRFPAVFSSEDSFRAALDGSGFTLPPPSTFSAVSGMSTVDVDPRSKRNRSGLSAVGSRIRDFEIEQELGRGGMGVVYRARDVRLGRDVALKMILGGAHVSSQHLERFLVEARARRNCSTPISCRFTKAENTRESPSSPWSMWRVRHWQVDWLENHSLPRRRHKWWKPWRGRSNMRTSIAFCTAT